MANCIPIDPELPADFEATPNESRSKGQLDAWWDHPYCIAEGGKFQVYCLNGGAWDRPSRLGIADTYDKACELAEQKQAEWVAMRAKPTFSFSEEPPFRLIRNPQRPDQQPVIVGEFATIDEMNMFFAEKSNGKR